MPGSWYTLFKYKKRSHAVIKIIAAEGTYN